jgi:hypothetical protein
LAFVYMGLALEIGDAFERAAHYSASGSGKP